MRSVRRSALAAILALSCSFAAQAAGGQQQTVDDAAAAVAKMRDGTGFVKSGLLSRAKAALIVPHAIRGAFGIGAQGGAAVLVENKGGRWTGPAFYSVGGVSIGPQIGAEVSTGVLLIMTDRALEHLLKPSNVTAGAQATLTAARYNADRIAELGGADVVIWSTSEGAFAGINVDLTGFTQDNDANSAYYGKPVDATAIFRGGVANPGAKKLRSIL